MKKILAIVLALVMVFSLSVTALAAPVELKDAEDPSQSVANPISGSVEVTVNEGVDTGVVYSVTVAWDDTSVVYQKEGKGTWNPSTHEYDNATEDGWTTNNTASVTVTNHSNAAVTATIAPDVVSTGTTYTFSDNGTFDLATAEGTLVAEAPEDTFTITAGGTPTTAGTDTFTVTITAAAADPGNADTVTFTVTDKDSNETEYTVEGNTTWAAFAANNSDAFTQRGNYIDSNANIYHNTLVSTGDELIPANSVIEEGAYTLSYALFVEDTAYIVPDEMRTDTRMSAFVEEYSEFSLMELEHFAEAFAPPILYTQGNETYYLTTSSGEPITASDWISNYVQVERKFSLLPADDYGLLQLANSNEAYLAMFLVPNSVATWADVAEANEYVTVDDAGYAKYMSFYIKDADAFVKGTDSVQVGSAYGYSYNMDE